MCFTMAKKAKFCVIMRNMLCVSIFVTSPLGVAVGLLNIRSFIYKFFKLVSF